MKTLLRSRDKDLEQKNLKIFSLKVGMYVYFYFNHGMINENYVYLFRWPLRWGNFPN